MYVPLRMSNHSAEWNWKVFWAVLGKNKYENLAPMWSLEGWATILRWCIIYISIWRFIKGTYVPDVAFVTGGFYLEQVVERCCIFCSSSCWEFNALTTLLEEGFNSKRARIILQIRKLGARQQQLISALVLNKYWCISVLNIIIGLW